MNTRDRLLRRVASYEAAKPQAAWHSVAPGVEIQNLHADKTGRTTLRMRMQPGSTFPSHFHHGEEQCLVLEGDARFGEAVYETGDFMVMPAGTEHGELSTRNGTLLLLMTTPEPPASQRTS